MKAKEWLSKISTETIAEFLTEIETETLSRISHAIAGLAKTLEASKKTAKRNAEVALDTSLVQARITAAFRDPYQKYVAVQNSLTGPAYEEVRSALAGRPNPLISTLDKILKGNDYTEVVKTMSFQSVQSFLGKANVLDKLDEESQIRAKQCLKDHGSAAAVMEAQGLTPAARTDHPYGETLKLAPKPKENPRQQKFEAKERPNFPRKEHGGRYDTKRNSNADNPLFDPNDLKRQLFG